MSTATPVNRIGFPDEYEVRGVVWSETFDIPQTETSTRFAARLFDKFQLVLLPFAAVAAIAAPSQPMEVRRVLSRAASSRTQRFDVQWLLDEWAYTTEPASLDEVQALNRLLALPAAEGLVVNYPDD